MGELVVPPPADGKGDPWKGSELARITPHWSNPMKETKPGN
jgi:hypothetical protein